MMRWIRWIAPVLMVLVSVMASMQAPAAAAADLEKARAMVAEVAEQGVREVVGANVPQAEKIERFRGLFDRYFDMPSIARFVLGRSWKDADAAQQARFVEQFRELNVYTWARRFKDYNGQKLAVTGVQADGDAGAYVDTMVEQTEGQKPLSVRWRLRMREDGWRVVDLIVEGVSMAITYRSEYSAALSDPSVTVGRLNDLIRLQVDQMKAQQPS
ncbi:MlaC/ttg2D family ABC transporter substrate-binding protein [Novispirillum itersonii]|uniref:Phospholipid transport system substrate-binding protein n=1 Tax=Novispirillum itersonii TaxID=189 RepID=A0A7W9ZH62_NOVIT|nr:ABC transporter substrate-binding protein [Novispirillum itersonii]MBB6211375.1 phospholipid transport system substrate-binding protein [Novispirillum itersonii]